MPHPDSCPTFSAAAIISFPPSTSTLGTPPGSALPSSARRRRRPVAAISTPPRDPHLPRLSLPTQDPRQANAAPRPPLPHPSPPEQFFSLRVPSYDRFGPPPTGRPRPSLPGSQIQTHLIDLPTAPAPPLTRNGPILTGRLPAAHESAPDHAGPHRSTSRPPPLQPSSHLHRPHPPARHPTTPHPLKNTPHHRARPSTTSRRSLCGTAVHAPVNGLRSRWTPPPTQSLGPRWIPPPTQPPHPPPHTPPPGLPLPRVVVDLTRAVYRKVFFSPGTKGFPPDRKYFIHRPRLPSSHTFTRASGYVAYSSPSIALGATTHNPEISPDRNL